MLDAERRSKIPQIDMDAEFTRNIHRKSKELFEGRHFNIENLSTENKHKLLRALFEIGRLSEFTSYLQQTGLISTITNQKVREIIKKTDNGERS